MTYARRVEIQREQNRATEARRKAHDAQASKSGSRVAPKVERPAEGWKSPFRLAYEAMTSWKSKKTLKLEAEVAARKAAEEASKAGSTKEKA